MKRSLLLATTAIVAAATMGSAHAAGTIAFQPIQAPTSDVDKRAVSASTSVAVNGTDTAIGFNTILRSGQQVGDNIFGLILDKDGKAIIGADGAPFISDATDFSSILSHNGRLYIVSHFESTPAAAYLTEVNQDASTGLLTAVSTQPIDFSADGGLWVPCAGSVTPWGTHLGSEEYEADAAAVERATTIDEVSKYWRPMSLYFDVDASNPATTLEQFRAAFNPYAYGWATEIAVNDAGTADASKKYAMGRFAHELELVMPDQKTVYLTDDGTNVGLYRFVADEAGKLDAGTLYAARFTQGSADNGGTFGLDWIDLGHADSAAIKALVDGKTQFSDMFDSVAMGDDGSCAEGYAASIANDVMECLKVKPGMEVAASRLESRRYAATLGATVELRKEEGVTYDPDHQRLYVAMSEIGAGMGDGEAKHERGSHNDIHVAENACGGVYALNLDAAYVATDMTGLVFGAPTTYADGTPYAGNSCQIDGLANPDNITYLAGYDTLFIGEDTGSGHQNDAVWAYQLADGALTRIETTPYGSETTSVYIYPNVNGHAYLMSVVQHPYGESDQDKLAEPSQARAYLGYIGPMPALN